MNVGIVQGNMIVNLNLNNYSSFLNISLSLRSNSGLSLSLPFESVNDQRMRSRSDTLILEAMHLTMLMSESLLRERKNR